MDTKKLCVSRCARRKDRRIASSNAPCVSTGSGTRLWKGRVRNTLCRYHDGLLGPRRRGTGQLHASLKRTAEWSLEHISFRSDGRQVAFAGGRDGAEVWDLDILDSGTRVWKYRCPKQPWVVRVAFSPQKHLVACLEQSDCGLVDAISGKTYSSYFLRDVAWSTDETRLTMAASSLGRGLGKGIEPGRAALSFRHQA